LFARHDLAHGSENGRKCLIAARQREQRFEPRRPGLTNALPRPGGVNESILVFGLAWNAAEVTGWTSTGALLDGWRASPSMQRQNSKVADAPHRTTNRFENGFRCPSRLETKR
jgi:hypothetical protein